jgi:hypothetical protein
MSLTTVLNLWPPFTSTTADLIFPRPSWSVLLSPAGIHQSQPYRSVEVAS